MLRSALRVRVAAPIALAALTLGMPSVAVAETTPTPSPTVSASSAPAPTPSSTVTTTPTPTPTKAAPAAPSPSTSPSATTLKSSPFGVSSLSAKRIAGTASEQAAYAGGFMVRTLAANGDHYNYPDSTFFDGGNTVDAILGLDGTKVGLSGADDAFAYVEDNVGGYIGTDFDSLYAGPAGKALLGVVAHGGDVNDFGGVDLVDVLLNDSLGAAEPGRFSDLPATGCGYDVCDYSNTIGQSLALIGVGRATGEVPDVAMDFLLDQQCADGGFRGDVDATTCVSDLDATAFAAQALVGRYGTEDAATIRTLDFLAGKQSADGGLLNQDGQSNSNTVGVAAQAFAAGGYAEELAKAQSFLAGLQFDCTAPPALRGGIAFTAADQVTLLKSPTDQKAYDQLLRSTPQATLGLAGSSLLDVTAEGAKSSAPVLACAGPSPTPTVSATPTVTPTVTPTTAPTTTAPVTAAPTTKPSGPAGTTMPGTGAGLAYTGASVAGPLGLAALLLLAGAATILFARRRGAHL
ncbi:hypothetical protein V6K52_07705 [Knoellia sp. S7-12]|uniref:hypothetical protein n=1 Tax=Knoellia sp. S7-12 TaxID=3126698 RepID=UPI003366D52B